MNYDNVLEKLIILNLIICLFVYNFIDMCELIFCMGFLFVLGGGDYAYSAAYSQYSSAPYSGYGYGAATSGLLSK